MQKRYKIWLTIIIVLIVLVGSLGLSKKFLFKEKKEYPKNTTSIISDINDFDYTLDNRDTSLMKTEFDNLTSILQAEEIDYEAYATAISKLFIIDFYTLNNKLNKYDVGGLEYILKDKRVMFQAKAMDTIYNDIIDNTYNDRTQELPEVQSVEVLDVTQSEITLNETKTPCYKVTIKFTYQKDLGYDNEGTIYLVTNANKLEIAIFNPQIEN